ncbi:TetR/AcrR family transcriptional regulator [Nocardia thailandica]|uniref:TetR/AcrR family transcriptional regulator n=1 Tax=Nocardia thailandica TaxID=257275 RepID=A0ABW6PM95_9NOCA
MAQAKSTGKSTRPERRAFTAEQVVDIALDLLDTGGPGALSIRAVAARLGVNPNAVYTYVASRADLERAVIERVLATVPLAPLTDPGVDWTSAVIQFALGLREEVLRHPGVTELLMTGPMDGPAARDVGEALLDCFARGGLTPTARARGVYAVIVQVIGSVALEVAETDGKPPLPPESERVTRRRGLLDHIDATRWPRTAASADLMADWISVDQFVWGLRAVLVGLSVS